MADERVRRSIARLAAQLMYERLESEYYTAKRKAAGQLGLQYRARPKDLPSNREIRDEIEILARTMEGDRRDETILDMRIEALRLMRILKAFRPHLIGSVLTGHVRKGSDIDLHLFSNNLSAIAGALEDDGFDFEIEHKRVVKHGEEKVFTHVHVHDRYEFELTVYPDDMAHYPFRSSVTGGPMDRATIEELEALLVHERPDLDLDEAIGRVEDEFDRFELYRLLLAPLERVKQSPKHHPEGDVLYHSLQVFELARRERPWDEEFVTAALLHDVGKGIDPSDHVGAALAALEGAITPRTTFLIAHHMDVLELRRGTLARGLRRRIETDESYEDLLLLRELDDAGRVSGADVCDLAEALDFLRELDEGDEEYEEDDGE